VRSEHAWSPLSPSRLELLARRTHSCSAAAAAAFVIVAVVFNICARTDIARRGRRSLCLPRLVRQSSALLLKHESSPLVLLFDIGSIGSSSGCERGT
jgi:hypothetical protein